MLIGKIDVKERQKILVTIRNTKKGKVIDVRVHNTGEEGQLVATEAGVSLTVEQVDRTIELLKEAQARVAGERPDESA